MVADNENIERVLEVVGAIVATNVVIPLDITKRVKFADEVSVVVTLDLLAV